MPIEIRPYTIGDVLRIREDLYVAMGRAGDADGRAAVHAAGNAAQHIYNYAMAGDVVRAAGRVVDTYKGWLQAER